MSEILRFTPANTLRFVITQHDGGTLYANDKEYKFFRQFSLPRIDVPFPLFKQTDTLVIQFDSSYDTTNVVTLYDKSGTSIETSSLSMVIDNTTYGVYQYTFDISALSGDYYVTVTGTDAGGDEYSVTSELFNVAATQCNTVLLEYYNNENAFGCEYETGITFNLRIPAYFNNIADTVESESFVSTNGDLVLINGIVQKARILKASQLWPQWLVEKVNIALIHDYCTIDGVQINSDNQIPYEVIDSKWLWSEPEATLRLQSGSTGYRNLHDSNIRELKEIPPVILSAIIFSDTENKITWSKSDDPDYFELQVSEDGLTGWTNVDSPTGTLRTYNHDIS